MMGKRNFDLVVLSTVILIISLCLFPGSARATFSIVAVDTLTGEVASAAVSCVDNVARISAIVEGVGAVNAQSYLNLTNLENACDRLEEGMTPSEVIAWLITHDADMDPDLRQYGIVTVAGPGASEAYSGAFCLDWYGHTYGPGYSIQGGRLLGPQIIDTVEATLLATEGPLEERVFAALMAGNIPGADSECLPCGKPGISAFIKVIRPGDGATPYLDEVVTTTACEVNPLDVLQERFDAWKARKVADPDSSTIAVTPDSYYLAGFNRTAAVTVTPRNYENNLPTDGMEVSVDNTGEGVFSAVTDNGDGTFSANLSILASPGVDTLKAFVDAGGQVIELSDKPVLYYLPCGDANADFSTDVGDAVYIINFVFKGGAAPVLMDAGDANCDAAVDIGDAVYLINYAFKSGPPPCANCP